MPDITYEITSTQKSDGALSWAQHNVLDPALNAGPLAIYNIAADVTHLPELHLAVDEAKPYSVNWFVQGLSGGVGAAAPFLLAGAGAGKVFRAADGALAGTKVGEALSPLLTSTRAANVAGATMFGALQKPEEGHTRFGNAVGMGLGFLVFDQGNMLSRDLPVAAKFASFPLTGFVGGAVMSEGSQLFSNGKLAQTDKVLQSAVQGMTLNSVIPLAHEGFKRVSTKSAPAEDQSVRVDVRANGIIANDSAIPGAAEKVIPTGTMDLHALSTAYSDWVRDNKPSYPTSEEFAKLTPEEIVQRGFYHPEATNLEQLNVFKEGKPRPLPDAKVVASEVGKSVQGMPMAGAKGDLILGEWNMEFLTGDKAAYFTDSYKQIVPRHHLMFVEEANSDGLAKIAQDNGYNFQISRDNSRGQAVGFLVHPRLKVLGTSTYEEIANVDNIPDLRPAFRVDLQDTATGEKFSAVTVHLKSMRGGPEATAPVRTEQAQRLATVLGPDFSGVIAGDWNTFLDKSTELKPLTDAGFKILNPTDATSTQSMGGRLDGFLYKNLQGTMSNPEVRPFFKNPLITRGLSDHGLLTTHLSSNPIASVHTFVPNFVGFDPSRN
jgi:hypothetical protein